MAENSASAAAFSIERLSNSSSVCTSAFLRSFVALAIWDSFSILERARFSSASFKEKSNLAFAASAFAACLRIIVEVLDLADLADDPECLEVLSTD